MAMSNAGTNVEVTLEAQGALPNFRYDIIQPLVQGRVAIEGAVLKPSGSTVSAGLFDNPRFREGDFGLLDANWGDLLPAIDAGWDLVLLPVFIKRKPVYNYLWVRADRGIEAPRDLEGKTVTSVGYTSAISTYTRGFLQHHWGVDLTRLRWLLGGPGAFAVHDKRIQVDYASGPRKSPIARLLDGEADASTGDITDARAWRDLEASTIVKRLFPDYQEQNRRLLREHQILTPVHVIAMGGKLDRAQPGLARRLYDAFERSREQAYEDALGDGSGYSITLAGREAIRDQVAALGDVWKHGLSANRNAVESFLDYNFEQGVTSARLDAGRVFAQSTLDT
jgi:4,5-dihydroxyphthalate decarboxylase